MYIIYIHTYIITSYIFIYIYCYIYIYVLIIIYLSYITLHIISEIKFQDSLKSQDFFYNF